MLIFCGIDSNASKNIEAGFASSGCVKRNFDEWKTALKTTSDWEEITVYFGNDFYRPGEATIIDRLEKLGKEDDTKKWIDNKSLSFLYI